MLAKVVFQRIPKLSSIPGNIMFMGINRNSCHVIVERAASRKSKWREASDLIAQ